MGLNSPSTPTMAVLLMMAMMMVLLMMMVMIMIPIWTGPWCSCILPHSFHIARRIASESRSPCLRPGRGQFIDRDNHDDHHHHHDHNHDQRPTSVFCNLASFSAISLSSSMSMNTFAPEYEPKKKEEANHKSTSTFKIIIPDICDSNLWLWYLNIYIWS